MNRDAYLPSETRSEEQRTMNTTVDELRDLAGRVRRGDPLAGERLTRELEPGLAHLVRRALRTGRCVPALQRWLDRVLSHQDLPQGESPPEASSSALATLLCAGIIRQLQPAGDRPVEAAETVVGA